MTWTDEAGEALKPQPFDNSVTSVYDRCAQVNRLDYGAITRLSYTILGQINVGVYASYRLSPVITGYNFLLGGTENQPSPWSVGIELELIY